MNKTSFPIRWLARSGPREGFALILGLVLLAGGARLIAEQVFETDHGARWIWAAGDYRDGEPIAFYAVRELELAAPPFSGSTSEGVSARVAITADETYLLFVNGRRIGAGSYFPEGPLDLYEIGDYLEPGWNRIVIEARSSRGAGGLIAELELDGALRPTTETHPTPTDPWYVATDDRWRIFRLYPPGLLGGLATGEGGDDDGESPKVWGRPPTGRWRLTAERRVRPIPFQGFLPPERRAPVRRRSQHTASWLDIEAGREMLSLGPQQLFDWGTEVEGFLSFNLRSAAGEPGLLYVSSDQPPDEVSDRPNAVVMPVPGRTFWEDAEPRRFRYVLLVGVEPLSRIEVDVLEASVARQLVSPVNGGGVFGFRPPRSYSKAQESVWGRLEDESKEQEAID